MYIYKNSKLTKVNDKFGFRIQIYLHPRFSGIDYENFEKIKKDFLSSSSKQIDVEYIHEKLRSDQSGKIVVYFDIDHIPHYERVSIPSSETYDDNLFFNFIIVILFLLGFIMIIFLFRIFFKKSKIRKGISRNE